MRVIDEGEIRKAVKLLHPTCDEDEKLFEVRIIDGGWNLSGYFTDAETLIEALQKSDTHRNENVYITLNVLNNALASRQQANCLMKNCTPTTSDGDVIAYTFLMIDLDPERAKGVSSSAEELEAARQLGRTIFKYMKATGWNDPIIAESGNGVHLLYKIGIKADGRAELVKGCLQALDAMFSTDAVKVDTTTFNPSRICKLYGTLAKKGANTEERPHRMSRIIFAPKQLAANDIALLEALAAKAPKHDEPTQSNNYKPQSFDLRSWIQRHGIDVKQEVSWNGGTKFVLKNCVFDPSHKNKDAAIIQTADGKICYTCFHASCADKHWKEVRLLFEPDAYSNTAPKAAMMPNSRREQPQIIDPGEPVWLTPTQINQRIRPKEEYIPTGIVGIDKTLLGLKKGFVTVLSGLRACGKSSIISQIAVHAAGKDFRTAIFSGELTAEMAMRWMYLQAATKAHVRPTRYENRWYVPDMIKDQIAAWLDGKIYIYNNDYGFDYGKFVLELGKCAEENKIDLIILDNMMCLDLASLDRDQFVRQSVFVNELEVFAKQKNVHIILIAHPRKSNGFLRLQDVSGSNDIVNRCDNAIIMHRNNHDFQVGMKAEFRRDVTEGGGDELCGSSNVLEICKDRDNGTQDYFIPLYFEPETKRMKNEIAEAAVANWSNDSTDEIELPF